MRNITIKTKEATITKVIPERFDGILWYAEKAYVDNKKRETLKIIKKLKKLNSQYDILKGSSRISKKDLV